MVPGIGGVLEELSSSGEDDQSDLSVAENRDLMSFLQQSRPPLRERHLAVDLVLDPLQLNPTSPHFFSHSLS